MLNAATERAVAVLQLSAAKSVASFLRHSTKQDCVSCHQQYLPMAAVGHARDREVRLDNEAAQDQIELMHRLARKSDDPNFETEYVLQAVFHPDPAHAFGYEAFALRSEKVPSGPMTDSRVHHLVTAQAADGRWHRNSLRPPIEGDDVTATALAIQAIRHYGWPGRKAEFDQAMERGRKWLWAVKTETTQEAAFQLLGLHWAGVPAAKLADLAKSLAAQQRSDGGWAQLPTLESDAYATGQVLYALTRAATVPTAEPRCQQGLRYLLATQHDDGSWYVIRRAVPFQPTIRSYFPHDRDSWISAAGTSWAVMALTQALTPAPPVDLTKQVDFARQVKPLLERSCIACHGPDKQRGEFQVDSRETLLKGGSSGTPAIVPGKSGQSPLVDYVSGQIKDMEMPPFSRRSEFSSLTEKEIELLRLWIDQGANWPKEVILVPPKRP